MQQKLDLPVLYSFRRCPYAIRARLALRYAGIHAELREVVLRDKPADMLKASPKGTVPVMVLAGTRQAPEVLEESLDIIHWALAATDPDGWLSGDAEAIGQLIRRNDEEFKYWLDRYKYPEHFSDSSGKDPLQECHAFLQELESRISAQHFLFGDTMSVADVAIFPFVRQFAFVDKISFSNNQFTAVQSWLNVFLQSDLFNSVMEKYPPWKAGDDVTVF